MVTRTEAMLSPLSRRGSVKSISRGCNSSTGGPAALSPDYRKLLATPCFECVIDIVGWKDFDPDGSWTHGWINIGVHSNHVAIWRQSLRQRIARAWATLRNEDPERYLDFYSRADVDEFKAACARADGLPPWRNRGSI
jgi:hypothetical protein